MIEKNLPLNPWLENVVQLYRESRSVSYLRDGYKMSCDKGEDLSWREFLVKSSLEAHLNKNPFLRKPLELLPLSDRCKDILYWAGVDKVSDLLQITKEELSAICINEEQVNEEITHYLKKKGKKLHNYPGRTTKLSLSNGYWTIPSPGASHCFNIARPTLRKEWFEVYYLRYGHFEGEEKHRHAFESVKPNSLDGLWTPSDYREFFQAAKNVFDSYDDCCKFCQLEPRVTRPEMPSRDVRFIYREALRALIDLFERTSLLKNTNVGDYLSTPYDETRLNIAEREGHNESFQLLLISHVEIKIDIENIGLTLEECLKGEHKDYYTVRHEHPFAAAIRRMRENVADETLRARYRKEVEENPDLGWEEFIVQAAISG